MIGRRQKSFYRLCELLRGVEADHENLQLVLGLNKHILREVLHAESVILRWRESARQTRIELKTGRKPKNEAAKLRRRLVQVETYIHMHYDQIYIWKTFGDGLAFLFLDKHGAKHVFFETESYNMKPGSGMLTGKTGLTNEVNHLLLAIEHGVPAVLSDITNIIRY